jgi:hypothetical protein
LGWQEGFARKYRRLNAEGMMKDALGDKAT